GSGSGGGDFGGLGLETVLMKAPRSLAGSIGFTSILSEDSGHDEVDRPHHRSRDRPTQEPGMRVDWGKPTLRRWPLIHLHRMTCDRRSQSQYSASVVELGWGKVARAAAAIVLVPLTSTFRGRKASRGRVGSLQGACGQ